jgi:hypothetical protein
MLCEIDRSQKRKKLNQIDLAFFCQDKKSTFRVGFFVGADRLGNFYGTIIIEQKYSEVGL